jgi:hypothetical protein
MLEEKEQCEECRPPVRERKAVEQVGRLVNGTVSKQAAVEHIKDASWCTTVDVTCCDGRNKKSTKLGLAPETVIRVPGGDVNDARKVSVVFDERRSGILSRYMTWVCGECDSHLGYSIHEMHKRATGANRTGALRRMVKRRETRDEAKGQKKYRALRHVDWGRHPQLHAAVYANAALRIGGRVYGTSRAASTKPSSWR